VPLPLYAQMSALNGMAPMDIDNDGKKDLVISGNLYPFRVQTGPLDASIGLILKGDGNGQFTPLPYTQTGLFIDGDVRNMIGIKNKNGLLLIVVKNDGKVQVLNRIRQ